MLADVVWTVVPETIDRSMRIAEAANEKLVIIGDHCTKLFDINEWTSVEKCNHGLARVEACASLSDGRVMALGYRSKRYDRTMELVSEIYDTASDSWTPGPRPVEKRTDFSVVTLSDGRVVIAGGGSPDPEADGFSDIVELSTRDLLKFESKTRLPYINKRNYTDPNVWLFADENGSLIVVKEIAFQPKSGTYCHPMVYQYDAELDAWSYVSLGPRRDRYSQIFRAMLVGAKIVISHYSSNDIIYYDLQEKEWATIPDMPFRDADDFIGIKETLLLIKRRRSSQSCIYDLEKKEWSDGPFFNTHGCPWFFSTRSNFVISYGAGDGYNSRIECLGKRPAGHSRDENVARKAGKAKIVAASRDKYLPSYDGK